MDELTREGPFSAILWDSLRNVMDSTPSPDLSHHQPLVTVDVGRPPTSTSYTIPIAQLEFWSPYLGNLIKAYTARTTNHDDLRISIQLKKFDKDAFDVFIHFMHARQLPDNLRDVHFYDFKGGHTNIPLTIKVWCLAHKLKGPSLILRDLCMQQIYMAYSPRRSLFSQLLTPNLPTIRYVLERTKTSGTPPRAAIDAPLVIFFMAVLAYPDMTCLGNVEEWKSLLGEYADFGREMSRRFSEDNQKRIDEVKMEEGYLGCMGEVGEGSHGPASRKVSLRRDVVV